MTGRLVAHVAGDVKKGSTQVVVVGGNYLFKRGVNHPSLRKDSERAGHELIRFFMLTVKQDLFYGDDRADWFITILRPKNSRTFPR